MIEIDNEKFETAHQIFLRYMLTKSKSGREIFLNFQHSFLVDDEIRYKRKALDNATDILQVRKWKSWQKSSGMILRAVREACQVSDNLLEHKYGLKQYSVYKVRKPEDIKSLEKQLFDFFCGGSSAPADFGPRFDAFANYLRSNRLGCLWDFVAYLSFLVDPRLYFPIRSSRFDPLLEYYGIGTSISGFVSWERYSILLGLAEALKEKLSGYGYGQPNAIEIQSYMWVVSYLLRESTKRTTQTITPPDFTAVLATRTERAKERERIGLLGEQFVYESEKEWLKAAQRFDLIDQVRLVSSDDDTSGYDILSFNPDGTEFHIEVKTTLRSPFNDNGFWLSESERRLAEQDKNWKVFRVWNIDTAPTCKDLGNIVTDESSSWKLNACNWFVQPIDKNASME